MLKTHKAYLKNRVSATDGDLGGVRDLLFDDRVWITRYFVVDTREWLPGRRVLVPPDVFGPTHWAENRVEVDLTREQIRSGPELRDDAPVSAQHELDAHAYYGWPAYWGARAPLAMTPEAYGAVPNPAASVEKGGDPHLRSVNEIEGYRIEAEDGEIGHVEEFVLDDEDWAIRYLVVDTRNWLPGGRKVLVAPTWASEIRWRDQRVRIEMTRELVKNSPEFDPAEPINRRYEERLFDYYGRPQYWINV